MLESLLLALNRRRVHLAPYRIEHAALSVGKPQDCQYNDCVATDLVSNVDIIEIAEELGLHLSGHQATHSKTLLSISRRP